MMHDFACCVQTAELGDRATSNGHLSTQTSAASSTDAADDEANEQNKRVVSQVSRSFCVDISPERLSNTLFWS